MGYIYLITNQITKKQYVGQTICKNIESRWNQHKSCDKNCIGRYLLSAYLKYGIDNFKFQIICICFDEDCNKFEEDYIKKFNTLVPNGYNLASGGKNSKQHPETIKRRVDKLRGRVNGPLKEETKKKISDSHAGMKNPNFGIKITEKRREQISNAQKKIWEERRKNNTFDEHIKKMTKGNGNFVKGRPPPNRKRVGKYDDKGILLEEYASAVEAGIMNDLHYTCIAKVCRGTEHYKTAGGFVWKFL